MEAVSPAEAERLLESLEAMPLRLAGPGSG